MDQIKKIQIHVYTLLILTFATLVYSLKVYTNGFFTYALDDTYIHLSMAKNLATKFILSVDGYHYANASSSPLYTIILAFFYVLPDKLFYYIPFLLNILSQILILIVVKKIIEEIFLYKIHHLQMILLFLLTPFIPLSFGGMEHSLQILLILLLLYNFLLLLEDTKNQKIKITMVILAPFVAFVRYENLALIFMISFVIALFKKDYIFSIILFISSFFFVFLFGLWSLHFGLGFFPSSIMAKSIVGDQLNLISLISKVFYNLTEKLKLGIYIDVLIIINLLILLKSKNNRLFYLSLIFILTTLIHASFSRMGVHYFYRYDAYLVLLGIINIYIFLNDVTPKKWQKAIIYSVLIIFHIPHLFSPIISALATKNIYEQQIQMAQFLKKYKNHANIAANDIGAITYFTEIKLLDLAGLGNYEVLKLIKIGNFNNETAQKLLLDYNVELIIVYEDWFKNISFENDYYKKMGEWKIKKNVVCGGDTVSFYSRKDAFNLNLELFKHYSEKELPKDVVYKIIE